ncbi:MAG: histidine phosphatase family protein [Candidatus Micrarchaeia archaeon]|jgi:probable phosphoglycerate mutase
MTRIIFVRHPESGSNKRGLVAGTRNVGLSEEGKRQAVAVVERLEHQDIGAVYSSPLRRAQFVAKLISKASGAPLKIAPQLSEVDYGIFQGKPREQKMAWWAEHWKTSKSGKYPMVPQGEDFEKKEKLMHAFVNQVCDAHPNQNVVFVTHATASRILFRRLLESAGEKISKRDIYDKIRIDNASVSVWDCVRKSFEKRAEKARL